MGEIPPIGTEVELFVNRNRIAVAVVESTDDDGGEFVANAEEYVYLRITASYHPSIPVVPRLMLRRPESGGPWERRGKKGSVHGIKLLEVSHGG